MKRLESKVPDIISDSAAWQKKIIEQTRDYLDFDVRMPTADSWFGNWLEGFAKQAIPFSPFLKREW